MAIRRFDSGRAKALNSEEMTVLAEELLDFQTLADLTSWLKRRQK